MPNFLNAAINSLKRKNLSVIADKVLLRLREGHTNKSEVTKWCAEKSQDWESFAQSLNPDLYVETLQVCKNIEIDARIKLDDLGIDLGGGGHYPLLYFLTRLINPKIVVETGVAAGWSSAALLTALKNNGGNGKLFSSDFPYFRMKNPERYIGFVVDDELKKNWNLLIDGDRNSIPEIARRIAGDKIGLFHYDSDKSYAGRRFAFETLAPHMADDAVIIFDDIQDNFHFRDWAENKNKPWRVFEFGGKFIGAAGDCF
jgi:predicted O-methyltransferase YrrM